MRRPITLEITPEKYIEVQLKNLGIWDTLIYSMAAKMSDDFVDYTVDCNHRKVKDIWTGAEFAWYGKRMFSNNYPRRWGRFIHRLAEKLKIKWNIEFNKLEGFIHYKTDKVPSVDVWISNEYEDFMRGSTTYNGLPLGKSCYRGGEFAGGLQGIWNIQRFLICYIEDKHNIFLDYFGKEVVPLVSRVFLYTPLGIDDAAVERIVSDLQSPVPSPFFIARPYPNASNPYTDLLLHALGRPSTLYSLPPECLPSPLPRGVHYGTLLSGCVNFPF